MGEPNGITDAPEIPDNTAFLFANEEPVAPEEAIEADQGAPNTPARAQETESPTVPAQIVLTQEQWDQQQRHEAGLRAEMIRNRQAARDNERRMLELQAERGKEQERLNRMLSAWERQNTPPPPDPSENPAEYIVQQNQAAIESLRQEMQQKEQAQLQAYQQAEFQQRFVGAVSNAEQEFAAQQPDYFDSVAYLRWQRGEELVGLGYGPDQIVSIVQQESAQFAATAASNGQNPAHAAYMAARSRGYSPQNAPQTPQNAPQSPQTVSGPRRVGAPNQAVSRMNTIAAGAASGRSLSQASGAGSSRGVTLQDLAKMDDRAFDEIAENPELWERLNSGETVYI